MGELLPTDVRARDDSPLAPSAADPSCRDAPTETPPLAMEGVSGVDANLSPSTTTLGESLAMSPSIRPMPGVVAWAANGTGHAGASGTAVFTPDYDPSITATATSTYVGRVTTGGVAPTMVSATSTVGSPVTPLVFSFHICTAFHEHEHHASLCELIAHET